MRTLYDHINVASVCLFILGTLLLLLFVQTPLVQAQCTQLTVSCFVIGPYDADIGPSDGSVIFRNQDAFVSVPYLSQGYPGNTGYQAPSSMAQHKDVGTLYGVAWPQNNPAYVFASAYMKRGTGFGPLGSGGVYRLEVGGTPPASVTQWATIPNTDDGTVAHNFDENGDHTTTSYDNDITHAHIGKTSLGDLEVDLSGNLLYVVNLYDKHLYSLPTTGTPPVSATDLGAITKPANCVAGDFRPFGLGVHPVTGILHIGAVCSNESSTSTDGLRGYVLQYNGSTFTQVFDFDLNYVLRPSNLSWVPWTGSTTSFQPMLADVAFLGEDLILGLRGRSQDFFYNPAGSSPGHGDVLRACWNETTSTWGLENGGACGALTGSGPIEGPGGGSFFADIDVANVINSSIGSVAVAVDVNSSRDRVVGTTNDPLRIVSGGLNYWNLADGTKLELYEVFRGSASGNGGATGQYGKAAGLGDIEDNCLPLTGLPIELNQFEALPNEGSVLLRWTTLSETENAGFAVEHRSGHTPFEEMGFVAGMGTTQDEQTYHFKVNNLSPGLHVFRLRQTDFDGSFAYSEEVEAIVDVPGAFYFAPAYPNPFNPSTTLDFAVPDRQPVTLALHDVTGRLIQVLYTGTPEANTLQQVGINAGGLPSGLYMVYLTGRNFSAAQKIVLHK